MQQMIHNCDNCLCRDTCYYWIVCGGDSSDCNNYKDASKFIESPVAIGTTVYIRHPLKNSTGVWVQYATVVGLHLRDTESRRGLKREEYMVVRGAYNFSKHIPFSQLGKTVFLTEEEAKEVK